jgi:HSP20 family protein
MHEPKPPGFGQKGARNMATETSLTQEAPAGAEYTRGGQVYRHYVDIIETSDELILLADMPGVKADAIEIDFEDGVLTIQGKVAPRYGENLDFLRREYGIGDYHRTFRVSERINASAIRAESADGVLTVHLPKVEAAKPRKIEVKRTG